MAGERTIDFRNVGDDFVIHYGGRLNEVDAYTFANSLVALANSMRATNAIVNPGQDIEIAIQAMGAGSFRAKVRATKKSLRNLFSLQGAGTGLIVGLLGNQIWQATHPDLPPTITVNDDSVVFRYKDATVILPREAYEAHKATADSKEIKNGIAEAFEQLQKDTSITEFGITEQMDDPHLILNVEREKFPIIAGSLRQEPENRMTEVRANLQIVRAILEKSNRLWEFVWQGNRIPASVTDSAFYEALYRRRVSLATGDVLDATLRIKQKPIGDTGLFENSSYEVTKVHGHTPRPHQEGID
jgi:hypothetical protein